MWLKDASCFEGKRSQNALNIVAVFNSTPSYYNCEEYTGNHTDWRLPNRKELLSLIDRSQIGPALPSEYPFANVQANGYYWSGPIPSFGPSNSIWQLTMKTGDVGYSSNDGTIWPVRAGIVDLLFAPTGFNAAASNCITGNGGADLHFNPGLERCKRRFGI